MTRQGSTGPGRPAALPGGAYTPPTAAGDDDPGAVDVAFRGEDGRTKTFPITTLPLPGWHRGLAAALKTRVGPAGTARTLASARVCWDALQRFVRVLAEQPIPPPTPAELTRMHVERFIAHRGTTSIEPRLVAELRTLVGLLRLPPLDGEVPPAALEPLFRRRLNNHSPGKPGYSEREFAQLLQAARADVAALRNRLADGAALLAAAEDPAPLAGLDADLDPGWFAAMATSGVVPRHARPGAQVKQMAERRRWAEPLFVTWPDVTSLLVLLVAVTGRNVETIKELPAEHRILDDRAVELRLTKRRRGPRQWVQTVTWEIGPPHRELHTPGGLYLLAHRLCARGRGFSGASSVWSIWRNGDYADATGTDEHFDPFLAGLHTHSPYLREWTFAHPLTGDSTSDPTADPALSGPVERLRVDFIRLKTTVDVRRTREMGGHLPSAARSNTTAVLFRNYLRDDPSTIDWARSVVGDALVDAEHAALDAHHRALAGAGGGQKLATTTDPSPILEGADTGWNRCADPGSHPATGGPCRSSFLDCFHCGNALITPAHLPRLLALLDALHHRHQQLTDAEWWSRYGPAWTAIRHDVLPKFSPAELDQAAAVQPADALLDLVEAPWQHP